MKRIVVLLDGTWNNEGIGFDTNVAKLDPGYRPKHGALATSLIRDRGADGTGQVCLYHDGVGLEGTLLRRLLGGAIGLGLKEIIRQAYSWLAGKFQPGDEVYLLGFSRGAYSARALAGMIGASGIQRRGAGDVFETAWRNYRVRPAIRSGEAAAGASDAGSLADYRSLAAKDAFHEDRRIKCVAVWDTVGSYGVPAGVGLAPLARYVTLLTLGFHDTRLGDHIDVGLHAVGIDEHRRPFVPTLWTIPKGQSPRGQVEQTWFAGAHASVGGGYPDTGMSDEALIWMIARLQALTGLEFDTNAVKSLVRPNIDGEVVDSTKGWPVDHLWPHYRAVLSPDAVEHGAFANTANPAEENIGERVHWSAVAKRGRPCTYLGAPHTPYVPSNMPSSMQPARIAARTSEEAALWP